MQQYDHVPCELVHISPFIIFYIVVVAAASALYIANETHCYTHFYEQYQN